MAEQFLQGKAPDKAKAVCQAEDILALRKEAQAVNVKENILVYMEDIVKSTREESRYVLGASPRALLALLRASQARVYLQGRDFVKPDDVKAVAKQVLVHRLVLSAEYKMSRPNVQKILYKNVQLVCLF